jgi:hypothetical protein
MAAGGSRRGFVPQAQAASQRLKNASAPPQSYGQRLELAEGISPSGISCHCTDKAGDVFSVPLHICRVVYLF